MTAAPVVRVVSLLPSATESLVAWGLPPVACTRFCEQPGLPTVGGTKNPDVAAIVDLAPDVVVMDTEENRREDADALEAAGLRLVVTDVHSVDDVEPTLRALADAVAFDWGGFEPLPGPFPMARRAFVPIWRRPWMSIGACTYGTSVIERLGVENVMADVDERYPTVEDLATVGARRPDVVLVPSEPYVFRDEHLDELRAVTPDVRRVDGQDLFWWGVRTPAALRRLQAELVAPPAGR